VTAAAFRALRPGMTVRQVDALIGMGGTVRSDAAGARSGAWTYTWTRGRSHIVVTFVGGRATIAAQAGLDTQPPSAPPATLAGFRALRAGMAMEEVCAVLGGPGSYSTFCERGGRITEGFRWRGAAPGSALVVGFTDGRVSSIRQTGLG
jgi:hypothetical protein